MGHSLAPPKLNTDIALEKLQKKKQNLDGLDLTTIHFQMFQGAC